MATRRKVGKPGHVKPTKRQPKTPDDDIALAEEIIRASRQEQAAMVAEFKKFMKQLGISGKPIGAKKLREMAIREGLDPNGTEFSRGIIEMREE
jgi:hypothetical protein